MNLPFRPSRRRALLDRYFALLPLVETDERAAEELSRLADEYEAGLPRLPLSRCPVTGFEMRHTFDPYGLDGLWWDLYSPRRPLLERLYTCQAITGAVRLTPPIERFPFVAKPGPGLPYVIPHLLSLDPVQAVLNSLPVGRHAAYCVAYFTPDEMDGVEWPNDWGTNRRWGMGGESGPGWCSADDGESGWDFDLRPWIEKGKLLWIAPGDESLTLRAGVQDCPYLNLQGERRMQRVYDGEVWFEDELDENELEEREL
jgi:hypothetical protein